MSRFQYTVVVECEGEKQADKVMAERILHDEDYGFDYTIDYAKGGLCPYCDGEGGDPHGMNPETGHPVWTMCRECDGTGRMT